MSFETYQDAIEAADEHYKAILRHPHFAKEYMPVFERLKELGWPETIDVAEVVNTKDITIRRSINGWMAAFGYKVYKCPATIDGRWKVLVGRAKKRVRLYIRNWPCEGSADIGNLGN